MILAQIARNLLAGWWGDLGTYLQILYVIAIAASVVLIILLIVALAGFSSGGDLEVGEAGFDGDAEFDVDPGASFNVFSIQTILTFVVTFSWSCILFMQAAGLQEWLASVIAVVIGVAALLAMAKFLQSMGKLQSSGNIELGNATGFVGEVYIPIPAGENGIGKVNITYQSRYVECNAVTKGDLLKTGTFVRVTEVRGTTLVVEKHNPEDGVPVRTDASARAEALAGRKRKKSKKA